MNTVEQLKQLWLQTEAATEIPVIRTAEEMAGRFLVRNGEDALLQLRQMISQIQATQPDRLLPDIYREAEGILELYRAP